MSEPLSSLRELLIFNLPAIVLDEAADLLDAAEAENARLRGELGAAEQNIKILREHLSIEHQAHMAHCDGPCEFKEPTPCERKETTDGAK